MNPARRPTRAISSDAGTVDSVVAVNWTASGNVASVLDGASMMPTSALTVSSIDVPDIASAWQQASSRHVSAHVGHAG